MLDGKEVAVHPRTPMPPFYTFVPKGNVYVTTNCRRKTHQAGQTVYVVTLHKKDLGLRCPTTIVQAVRAAEKATRAARHDATAKRDAALAATFKKALLARYPKVPADTVPEIVQHALKKRQRRVARTSTLDEDQRVQLAVRAHIRHRWTDYDKILREGDKIKGRKSEKKGKRGHDRTQRQRREARAAIMGRVDAIEREWAGGKAPQQSGRPSGNGPIEISDSEESMDESEESEEDEEEEGDDDEDDESEDEFTEHSASERRDRRIGKGASIASQSNEQLPGRKAGSGSGNKITGSRIQKTTTTPPAASRHPRSSKSRATVRIARCQQKIDRLQAAAAQSDRKDGDKKETAIVIDSDSEWEP
ncbi:hypothetical protein Sste5346_007347 [Sporothrix stenoceras]|uniref:DUF2293 domain-containing protein n=1 Tax=Sporothrix stenoceras TaxID=5173 RepID=A0ABR3YW65_9PEZI